MESFKAHFKKIWSSCPENGRRFAIQSRVDRDTVDDSSSSWWIYLIKFHSVWRMNEVVCTRLNFHFLNSDPNRLQAFYSSQSQGQLNSLPLGSKQICHRWRWWHSSQHKGEIKTGIWHRMPLKPFIRQLYFRRYPLGVSQGSPFGVRLSSDWASQRLAWVCL